MLSFYSPKVLDCSGALKSNGETSFLIDNFVGVYLKSEVNCVKTKLLAQIAEEQRKESGYRFMSRF